MGEEEITSYEASSGQGWPARPWVPSRTARIAIIVGLLLVGAVSFFVLGPRLSSVKTYEATIAALDEKRKVVMGLVTGSTAASAAMSVLPGDAGTPIAEKLADLSTDFLIVLAAIWLEKYLLTILGAASTRVLIPLAMVAFAAAVALWGNEYHFILRRLASKLLLFAICLVVVVPTSVWISSQIESTYQSSLNDLTMTEEGDAGTGAATAEAATDGTATNATTGTAPDEGGNMITNFVSSLFTQVGDGVTGLTQEAQNAFNGYIEALAMMIVTSCVIPVLVLVFFLLLMRTLLGVPISIPTPPLGRRGR